MRYVNGNGKKTTNIYDDANRLINVQTPVGLTTFTYTHTNLLETVTDPNNLKTTYQYDAAGQLTTTIYADNSSVIYHYDPNGNRDRVTDGNGNVTTFTYNETNQLRTTIDPFNRTTTYEYDDDGRNDAIVDRRGWRRVFTYDAADRLDFELWEDELAATVQTIDFEYDDAGNVRFAQSDDGTNIATYSITYDRLNRASAVDEPFGKSLGFSYDAAGNRTAVTDSDGVTVTSTYNNLNLLSSRKMDAGGGQQMLVSLTYTNRHQIGTITRYSDLAGSSKVGETRYQYDDSMRLTTLTHDDGSATTLASYLYSYDDANRIQSETINGAAKNYDYDDVNQLETDGISNWTYDDNGNRNDASVGPGNQLSADSSFHYSPDFEGNLRDKFNFSTGYYWEFTYDHRNQMTQATLYDYDDVLIQQTDYVYGPFGERLKSVHITGGGSGNWTREYAYDAWNPEKIGSQGNSAWDVWADLDENDDIVTRYLHGDDIDAVWARTTSGYGEQWLLGDHLGSIRDITWFNGGHANTITYDAWGKLISQTNGGGAADIGRYAWAGRERDAETDFQYNRARYYDPANGRWTTEDPIGFNAGDSNLYRYVREFADEWDGRIRFRARRTY